MLPHKSTILLFTISLLILNAVSDTAAQTALGRFQTLPLSCYTCADGDCSNDYFGSVNKCRGNETCATVFGSSGTVIARGCSEDLQQTCGTTGNQCYYCQSTGCNVAVAKTDYVDCVSCDTENDVNCFYDASSIKTTRKCYQSCMTSLYPRNDETDPAYELTRSCLDDYDLDDRETCEAGNLKNCVACTGASCNTVKVPAVTRHQCYICEGDDCQDPQILECPAYRANDQCFMEFSADSELIRLGCKSSLDASYIEERLRRLAFCSGDSCNLQALQATQCFSCTSDDNQNCLNSPTTLKTCDQFPNTQCVTYLQENGGLTRDCVYNVPTDTLFEQCLSSDDAVCKSCSGNSCNNDALPADRVQCLQCDAAVDANCDTGSQEYASYCKVYKQNDTCVTSVFNGLTRRSCESEFTCDASDRKSCQICTGNNCNTANLVANEVGEPGRWQDLPLACYQCNGTECASGLGTSQTCTDNNVQNCFTVFDARNTIIARGCSDVVLAQYSDYCTENSDKCIPCKSNNCNNANRMSDYIDCHYCDSATKLNCAVDFVSGRTRKCKGACMVALYPGNTDANPNYETVRTCLDDKEVAEQTTCQSGRDANCVACTTSLCNTQEVPADRLECFQCLDESCESTASSKCKAYAENDQCFVLYGTSNNIINMGCRSDIITSNTETLTRQKQLWLCSGNNCNNKQNLPTETRCVVCDSTTDENCAINPDSITTYQNCSILPYTDCATKITSSGATMRGCLSSFDEDDFYDCVTGSDTLCERCTSDSCNGAVYPANRLQCYQCDSSSDSDCVSNPSAANICPLYMADDACVTTIQNTYTLRGCKSSVTCADESDVDACNVCTTNNCNTVNLEKNFAQGSPGKWQQLPLSCYTCNSVSACATLGTPTSCTTDIYQRCVTVFSASGAVQQRGCSNSVLSANVNYCDANPNNCLSCNSNRCNLATSLSQYVDCIFCDTERDGTCANNPSSITTTRKCYQQCVTALYTPYNETNPTYHLSRSCLDDLEASDRQLCVNGNKEFCQACNTANCNTAIIPQTRLSCNHCNGEDCDEPIAQQCAQYRENDTCYIQFDETHSVTRLGCRSDFSNDDADELFSQQRLYYCQGDNCNTLDIIPDAQTCTLCSSRTDERCATNPTNVLVGTSCGNLPYTNCYTRVLSDGATERGCLSNLAPADFSACFNGENENCTVCTGTRCNNQVFPENRLSCQVCDSSSDSNCETRPDSLQVCLTYSANEQCVSSIVNDVTYRGCSSQVTCEQNDAEHCQVCSEDGCNTANLRSNADNNFGKWQDLPLTCLDCSGADGCGRGNEPNQTQCSSNLEQDCLTVFDASGTVVRRGCADNVKQDYSTWCAANPSKCYNCKSNRCNTAYSESEFVSCLSCDTFSNADCLANASAITARRQCQGGCLTALYPAFIAEDPAYELIRTCLNDKESGDRQACLAGDTLCTACTAANCNSAAFPAKRLQCYQCNGDDCVDPELSSCPLYKSDDKCYSFFDDTNSITQMGCLSSFNNVELESLIGSKRVKICEGDGCNSQSLLPVSQQCVVCNSLYDPLCATNAYGVSDLKTCSNLPYTSCYTAINSDGETLRGCVYDLEKDDFTACVMGTNDKCKVCDGDGCNRELFPADRLQCYTCDSNSDSSCESNPQTSEICVILTEKTGCRTALMGNNVTVRGCSDDVLCDQTDINSCRTCNGTNCNTIKLKDKQDDGYHGFFQSLPLSCYACVGDECLNSLGVSGKCTNNDNQDCLTVFDSDGSVRRRGCSDAVEDYEDLYCRQNPDMCFRCKSNDCNVAWNVTDYVDCYFCDSAEDEACAKTPVNVVWPTRKCYKECLVAAVGERIIRSCLDDKEMKDQSVCKLDNNEECATCTENQCNNFVFPLPSITCHVCSNSACTSSTSQRCPATNDFCIAKYENNRPAILGCASSVSSDDLQQWAVDNQLYRCDTNDCNALSKLPVAISCVNCNGTADCAQNPQLVSTVSNCNPIIGQCYSLIDSQGLTSRGCLSNLPISTEYVCVRDGTCKICEGNRCNNQIYPEDRRRCVICKSENDQRCSSQLSVFQGQVCPIYETNGVCVTRLVNGKIERGCGTELTCDINDTASCVLCSEDNCNIDQLAETSPSAASAIIFNKQLFVSLIFILSLGFYSN